MNIKAPTAAVPRVPIKMNWFEFNQKNKPQGNSVIGGLIIMMVSGLHISYGIFNTDSSIKYNLSIIKSSWYVGVLLASVAANFFIDKWEKKIFYYIGAVACAVGSGMFFEPMSDYEELIIIGRFIAGIGHGLVYMPLVIHSGENSVRELRGMLLSSINFSIMISVATGSLFNLINITMTETILEPKLLLAILGLVYSAMALIFIPMMFYESPVFLIRNNRESEALVNMIKLRSEQSESYEVRTDFDDLRQMIEEDKQTNTNIFDDNNLRPLIIVTLSKLLSSLSFSYPLNLIRLIFVIVAIAFDADYVLVPIALIFTRSVGGLISFYGMDKVGRKLLMTASASLCGASIIVLGIILKTNTSLNHLTIALITFFLLFDMCHSLGIGMVPDVLASEAFPVTKKSLSITFASVIDTLFNMILIIITPHVMGQTFIWYVLFGFGAVLLLGAGVFYLIVPETRMMSLRQSRDVLRGSTNQQIPLAHHNF